MKFIFASENHQKFKELQAAFPFPIIHEKLAIIEIQGTITEIVLDKAKKAYDILTKIYGNNICVICDDVGLEINVLNKLPGPYIKYFLKIGVRNFEHIVRNRDNSAEALCALCVCYLFESQFVCEVFVGRIGGHLVFDDESYCQFNFDGFFVPEGSDKSYGRMCVEEKNAVSHRGIAVSKMVCYIEEKGLDKM